ncbi:MAG: N-acetylmuramic acid 6-phosphate etherase [Capsulimonadaceae bacterium]
MSHEIHHETAALARLTTEALNPDLMNIDSMDTEARLRVINAEDARVAAAVEVQIPNIARAVHRVVHSFRSGGRLIYVGSGTSGRLGVLDAAECPPTFGVPPEMVLGIIAGGPDAVFHAVEGAEDDLAGGAAAMIEADVNSNDTVVGISASGRAPFVLGALLQARKREAATVVVTNNQPSDFDAAAGIVIAVVVGPEVLAGSTRLKSGTAQKMVLNMISTGAMMEIGKTYGNLMVDLQATNTKLVARATRIVAQVTGCTLAEARAALEVAEGSAKVAIVMVSTGKTLADAQQTLAETGGFLRRALARSSHQ